MAKKELTYKGKTVDELKKISLQDFIKLVPSRQRRTLMRGFTEPQKILLKKIRAVIAGKYKKPIKTHCRNMIIVPEMLDMIINVYTGKDYMPVMITPEHLGKYLGEFGHTRRKVEHSAPGIGATKSSAAASVK